ncbi:MAG: DUF2723 domain-containing protein [Kofleriaceae bacterium]
MALSRGGLVALVCFGFTAWLSPAHIVDGDNAEFATLGAVGGVAHPSGYPLYVLWLRALSWLPGTPAHAGAVATALLGALQVLVLHAACRAWGARANPATVAVAIFAAAPVVLRIHSEAEVFALNGLVVAAVLWLAAEHGPLRGGWRAFALALVAGLGLANHMTCALVAPVGLLGVVRGVRETERRALAIAGTVGGLVAGLSPYLYVFVAPPEASWGSVASLGDLIGVITRTDYGGPGAFAAHGAEVPITDSLAAFAGMLGRTWLWILPIAAIAVLVLRIARPRDGEPRTGWAMLGATWLIAGPILITRFNVDPEGLGLYVCQRFYVLPALLLVIPIAAAIDGALEKLGGRAESSVASGVLAVIVYVGLAASSLPYLSRVHSPAVQCGVVNLINSLPQNAVVIGIADDHLFGIRYAQLALGIRPDVTYVQWPMVRLPWYRERLAARGVVVKPGPRASVDLADALIASGREVFLDNTIRVGNFAGRATVPHGIVHRVLGADDKVPSLREVVEDNKRIYASFDLSYPRPGIDDEWATEVHRRYANTWFLLERALLSTGDVANAQEAADIARQVGPQ